MNRVVNFNYLDNQQWRYFQKLDNLVQQLFRLSYLHLIIVIVVQIIKLLRNRAQTLFANNNMQKHRLHSKDMCLQGQKKSCVIQLLQPHCVLITNFEQFLPQHVITSHQMVYSPPYRGYFIRLNMLNSLKRFATEDGYAFPSLPKMVFKLHRQTTEPFNQNLQQIFRFLESWGLKENQHSAIRFFISNQGRIIIGDQWLMGKTLTALAIIEIKNYRRIAIIAPNVLLAHWVFEIKDLFHQKNTRSSKARLRFDKMEVRSHEGRFQISTEQRSFFIVSQQYLVQVQNHNPSYEQLLMQIKTADYLIVDQPEHILEQIKVKAQKELQIEKNSVVSDLLQNNQQEELKQKRQSERSKNITQQNSIFELIKKPKNIVILSSRADQLLIDLIPWLNAKVSRQDMEQRYLNHPQHSSQLKKIAYEYYIIKTARKSMKPPSFVKKIVMPDFQLIKNTERNASTRESTSKSPSLRYIIDDNENSINRIQFISNYIRFLIHSKNVRKIMLICQSPQFAQELGLFLNNKIGGLDFKIDPILSCDFIQQQLNQRNKVALNEDSIDKQVHSVEIIMCQYSQTYYYRQFLDQNSRALFCELLPKNNQNKIITKNCTDKVFMKCYQLQYFVQSRELQRKFKQFEYPDIEFDPTINGDIQCKDQELGQPFNLCRQQFGELQDGKNNCKKERRTKYVYYDAENPDNCIYIEQEQSNSKLCEQNKDKISEEQRQSKCGHGSQKEFNCSADLIGQNYQSNYLAQIERNLSIHQFKQHDCSSHNDSQKVEQNHKVDQARIPSILKMHISTERLQCSVQPNLCEQQQADILLTEQIQFKKKEVKKDKRITKTRLRKLQRQRKQAIKLAKSKKGQRLMKRNIYQYDQQCGQLKIGKQTVEQILVVIKQGVSLKNFESDD